jgi:hypothetical protein
MMMREAHPRRSALLVASAVAVVAIATVAVLAFVGLGGKAGQGVQIASPADSASRTPAGRRHESRTAAPRRRLFAADSVWNAPLPEDAALDPASATLVKTLVDTVAQNKAAGIGPWISVAGTSPMYVVRKDQRSVRVRLDSAPWKAGLRRAFRRVPIPPDAKPAAGPDGHLTVWQPSTDRLWEFFKARKQAGGWHADFGGAMTRVSRSPGYYNVRAWPGLSHASWGATATSLPVIAGTMMINELKAGVIPHALAMNIPFARSKVYSWPAQRTDGKSTDPNAIPEGARFRLDPTLDLSQLHLSPMARMMAEAAQRYGAIVRDQTGHAVSFFAENPVDRTSNPYLGKSGFYGARSPLPVLAEFPWEHLQVLKMSLRTGK